MLVGVSLLAIATTVGGWCAHRHGLGLSLEEYRWQGAFDALAGQGYAALWRTPIETWRPMCASLLVASGRCSLSPAGLFAVSAALLLVNAVTTALLAGRLGGRRAMLPAMAIALAAATHDEVYLWLGGRCDLVFGAFAVLAAHAMVSSARAVGGRAWLAALAAAVLSGLAAASKETGLLLPCVLAPCVLSSGRLDASSHARLMRLAPALLTCAALGVVRSRLMHGAFGPYVGAYVARGPGVWLQNLLVGTSRLVLGPALHPSIHVSLTVGALAICGGAIAMFRRPHGRLAALSLLTLLAPVALMPADRALYPVVLACAVLVSVVVASRPRARTWMLCVWLALHAASSIVMQVRWVRAYAMRAAYVGSVQRWVVPGLPLVLIGGRQFFNGLYVEGPSAFELRGSTTVVDTCRTASEFPSETQALPTHPRDASGARFVLPVDTRCLPTLPRGPLTSVVQHGCQLELALNARTVLVWWDADGRSRSMLAGP